jgi:hypothetical protein
LSRTIGPPMSAVYTFTSVGGLVVRFAVKNGNAANGRRWKL